MNIDLPNVSRVQSIERSFTEIEPRGVLPSPTSVPTVIDDLHYDGGLRSTGAMFRRESHELDEIITRGVFVVSDNGGNERRVLRLERRRDTVRGMLTGITRRTVEDAS